MVDENLSPVAILASKGLRRTRSCPGRPRRCREGVGKRSFETKFRACADVRGITRDKTEKEWGAPHSRRPTKTVLIGVTKEA